jgi:prophage regulatory protein
MQDRILPPKATARRCNVGVSTMYRLVAAGRFPRQRQLSPGRVGWLESEVAAWIAGTPKTKPLHIESTPASRPR